MTLDQAIADLEQIFKTYAAATPTDLTLSSALAKGKVYELRVLSVLLEELKSRGAKINLQHAGGPLKFKGNPGKVKLADPYFEVIAPSGEQFWVFVDIEFQTLGSSYKAVNDHSRMHELDIVVLTTNSSPYPRHDQIALGIECKGVDELEKHHVRGVLGVRRELSFFREQQPSTLSLAGMGLVFVPANPPSELWLAYLDPDGGSFSESPAVFGIELKYIPM